MCNVQICVLRMVPSATVSTVRIQFCTPSARFTGTAILRQAGARGRRRRGGNEGWRCPSMPVSDVHQCQVDADLCIGFGWRRRAEIVVGNVPRLRGDGTGAQCEQAGNDSDGAGPNTKPCGCSSTLSTTRSTERLRARDSRASSSISALARGTDSSLSFRTIMPASREARRRVSWKRRRPSQTPGA